MTSIPEHRVYCATTPTSDYGAMHDQDCPEFEGTHQVSTAHLAVRRLFHDAKMDVARFGTADWNPLGDVIEPGQRVVIKPNWVSHRNQSGMGLDCLITHTSVIEAILRYVHKAKPASMIVGDAPVQGCNFAELRQRAHFAQLEKCLPTESVDPIRDFRRTIMDTSRGRSIAQENLRGEDEYILFDLGAGSLLEEISDGSECFRVTQYDPSLMHRTHAPGRHQYLVAREIIEAEVVISVPKLKTHRKAGITGALKNMVGINGNKEYLPHHRKGSTGKGGDCYPRDSRVKGAVEDLYDAAYRTRRPWLRSSLLLGARLGMGYCKLTGIDRNIDGSWYGNDTVWRMCLDLQRILHYGQKDGSLADDPQRRVLTITDGIVAGEGDGPLAPEPVDLQMMTLGQSTATVEWVHALIMGLNPQAIPLLKHAMALRPHGLTRITDQEIRVVLDGKEIALKSLASRHGRAFRLPSGWEEADALRSAGLFPSVKGVS